MSPQPTGRIIRTAAGKDLELVRTFRAPIEDVWASITEPERTARWFGWWKGRPGAGSTIRYSMVFEEGSPEAEMTIAHATRRIISSCIRRTATASGTSRRG